ncbi:MAG: peptidoglycan-binding protein [Alphaproteobacteria bacterium]|nr:peptidoglycan-binding protein [Alphaproteobacteria bacterium]
MTSLRKIWLVRALAVAVLAMAGGALAAELAPQPELPPLSERVKTHEALRLLADLGYDSGAVDGTMTANIAGAIREFQRARNLPVDGKVTDGLLAALRSASQ